MRLPHLLACLLICSLGLFLTGCGGGDSSDDSEVANAGGNEHASAGEHDMGSGEHDSGSSEHDSGSSEHDSGSSEHDSGSSEHDSGSSEHDSGSSEHDSETGEHDSGSSEEGSEYGEYDSESGESSGSSSEHDPESGEMGSEYGEHDAESSEHDAESSEHDAESGEHDSESSGSSSEHDAESDEMRSEYGEQDPGSYESDSNSGETDYGDGKPRVAKPVTYLDKAQQAFKKGDDQLAFNYLYAHGIVADPAAAKTLLDKIGLIQNPPHPSLAVRWGIGFDVTLPPMFNSSLFPIGTTQNIPIPGTRRPAGGEGEYGGESTTTGTYDSGEGNGGGGQGGSIDPLVQEAIGELGVSILEQMQLRLDRGDYGEILKNPMAVAGAPTGNNTSSNYESGGYESSNYESGEYGNSGYDSGGGQNRGKEPHRLMPGMMMVGVGKVKDLVTAAKGFGVDALLVCDIDIRHIGRSTLVTNDTTISVYNVAIGNEEFDGKKLTNTDVERARAEAKDDGVAKMLVALFKHIDGNWQLKSLPPMTSQQVIDRISILLKQSHDNPLPVLAEIRMYQTRGLLADEHLLAAYKRLLGDQLGTTLATGSDEEKKQVVKKWLEAAAPDASEDGPRDILDIVN